MKKKLGIATYYYFYNYGTVLQGFATQLLFDKQKNMAAELIDFRFASKTAPKKIDIILTRIRRLFVYMKEYRRVYAVGKYRPLFQKRNKYFDDFIKLYLKTSSSRYNYEQDIVAKPPSYDIYLTGSDQTWSPKIGFSPFLFLDFAPKDSIIASYAPSLGVSSLSQDESSYLQKHLAKYKFLSCRESLGSKILENLLKCPVETVLDPTLMISAEEWSKYAVSPSIEGKYILCYFLGDRDYYRNYVAQLSKQTKLPVYYIPVNWKDFKKKNNLLWEVGPSEFLGLIRNAEYICTDSFHGTIFSVNFHKEVRVFVKHAGNISGGDNSRLYDVLERLGITKQLITDYKKGSIIQDSSINYMEVDRLLATEREKSLKYVDSIANSIKK